MAILKNKKIRELGDKDVEDRLRELQLELSKERASSEIGGTVKNPGRMREIRRTIARIKTHQKVRSSKNEGSKNEKKKLIEKKEKDNIEFQGEKKQRGGDK